MACGHRQAAGDFECDQVLVKMWLGGASNRSLKAMMRKRADETDLIRRSGVRGVGTLIRKNLRKLPQYLGRRVAPVVTD